MKGQSVNIIQLIKSALSILCFLCVSNVFSQQKTLKEMFNEDKYQKIISSLETKQKTTQLNYDELYYLSSSYGRLQKYSNGLFVAGEMYKRALENADTTNLVKAINVRVGNLVDLDTDKKFALDFTEKSLKYFRKQDSVQFQLLCFKLGALYYQTRNFNKAYETYQKITIKRFRETQIFKTNYAITLEGLNKHDSAVSYLKKNFNPNLSNDMKLNRCINIANVYIEKQKWDKAKVYLDSASVFLKPDVQLKNIRFLYERFYAYSIGMKDTEQALYYVKKIKDLNQDILQKKITEKIASLENSYNREKKLTKDIKIIDNELTMSRKKTVWGALISIFTILLLVIASLFYKNKIITQENQNIVTEQKLLRSQMTPHFIFNSLSVLQGMILNKEEKKSIIYLSKFSKLLRLILENSREKLVLLNDELVAVINYMDLQKLGARKEFDYTVEVEDDVKNEEVLIPPMIIQPYIENAIEHGFTSEIKKPRIDIKIFFKKNDLVCEIIDNGVGINQTQKEVNNQKKSLATKITAERMKIYGKQLKANSNIEILDLSRTTLKGTKVILILPYKLA